ncbi:MAG TPA: hypothetical protein ENI81_09000 [Phycisphaerales bacterium]|nr:hypothetical protein [Phycisphaerales bacterium]
MKTRLLSIIVAALVCGFLLDGSALAGEQSGSGPAFSWYSLVKPLGIATLSLVALTFLTGLLRKKLRRRFLNIHLPLAAAALTLGLAHGLLIFILYR